jgi:hypothetical protein
MISDEGLLYIERTRPASTEPVLDQLTRKMAAAFRKARLSERGSWGPALVVGRLKADRGRSLPPYRAIGMDEKGSRAVRLIRRILDEQACRRRRPRSWALQKMRHVMTLFLPVAPGQSRNRATSSGRWVYTRATLTPAFCLS